MRAIGPELTTDERAAFIGHARVFVRERVRWRHQGRSLRGIDCGGLVAVCINATGRCVDDATGYGRHPYRQMLEATLDANFGPMIPKEVMQAGDIALIRFAETEQCSHVGIVADYPSGGFSLIHAFAQMKCVVEHRIDDEWYGHIAGVYRP